MTRIFLILIVCIGVILLQIKLTSIKIKYGIVLPAMTFVFSLFIVIDIEQRKFFDYLIMLFYYNIPTLILLSILIIKRKRD